MTLELIDTTREIENKIHYAILVHLDNALKKSVPQIEQDVSTRLKQIFISSPEYLSLTTGGKLSVELGIPGDVALRLLDKVINTFADSLVVDLKDIKSWGSLARGFFPMNIYIHETVIDKIIALPESSYLSNQRRVDWMEWLLTKGNQVILANFKIQYGNYAQVDFSRTGGAIMIEGGTWRIPPEFAGTYNDNWITRAIDNNARFLQDLITASIKRNIEKNI